MTDLADLTISAAGVGLRAGDFTSVDLLEAVTKRASMTEAQLHAYLTLDHEGAPAQARFTLGITVGVIGLPFAVVFRCPHLWNSRLFLFRWGPLGTHTVRVPRAVGEPGSLSLGAVFTRTVRVCKLISCIAFCLHFAVSCCPL